jgi:hypothetical protein
MDMIPAGYMLKKVARRPEWIAADSVVDIYSLSGCISEQFADYIRFWKHNSYWLFDSPGVLKDLTESEKISVSGMTLFYYELYPQEYNDESKQWSMFFPNNSFPTAVEPPAEKSLAGFDVTTYSLGGSPECSPLSCCALAKELPVNQHCLFRTFEEAKSAVASGKFANSEPGPFRLIAVYLTGR